ncbi:MAG: glycosyltransferase [Mycobacteriales bacterium]
MRVAWLTDDAPDRRHGGTGIRQSHLLEAVARRHEVHLLSTGGAADPATADLLASSTLVAKGPTWWPRTRTQRRLHDLWLAGPGGPLESYLTAASRAALASALRAAGPFDVVAVEHAGLVPLVRGRRPGEAWAVTLHNVASSRAAQQRELSTGLRRRLVEREAVLARRVERQALRDFDLVTCVSALDAGQLPPSPRAAVEVVDNGVDLAAFAPSPLPGAPVVVFTGTLSYAPNVDGTTWFVEHAWPRVRAAVPAAELLVVGRLPAPEVLALAQVPGVSVHPDVPDVRPYLDRSRVCLVPLRMGSGTRLKALEAMSAGRPVAGTAIGLEGLPVRDGEHALVADEPAALADAVVALLTDDALAERLASAARALVEDGYGWDALGARYADALGRLTAARGG